MASKREEKFLVVSYDEDQQQWFWDSVIADNAQDAAATVCAARPYVISADAADLRQLQQMLTDLTQRSEGAIKRDFVAAVAETGTR